jgi:hypothetical protein
MAHSNVEVHISRNSELQGVKKSEAAPIDDGKYAFLQWPAISDFSNDSITWTGPSSFVIYSDGSWALAVGRLYNGYDNYQPWERHFSVRWYWVVNYLNAQGSVIYQSEYVAGGEGYKGSTSNIVLNGNDAGFLQWRDQIATGSGFIRYETFY